MILDVEGWVLSIGDRVAYSVESSHAVWMKVGTVEDLKDEGPGKVLVRADGNPTARWIAARNWHGHRFILLGRCP